MCWLACRTPSSVLPATRSISIHLRLVALNLAYDRLFQQTLTTQEKSEFISLLLCLLHDIVGLPLCF